MSYFELLHTFSLACLPAVFHENQITDNRKMYGKYSNCKLTLSYAATYMPKVLAFSFSLVTLKFSIHNFLKLECYFESLCVSAVILIASIHFKYIGARETTQQLLDRQGDLGIMVYCGFSENWIFAIPLSIRDFQCFFPVICILYFIFIGYIHYKNKIT